MFHTYQYISIQTTVHTKNSGGSLTDNRMPSHFLGNHGGITAQKYRHRRNAVASMRLGQLIDGASVECAVNSPPSGVELDIRVGVLSACKASIAQQLLDGVIQAAKEEDQALVSVESLSKVSPLDPLHRWPSWTACGSCGIGCFANGTLGSSTIPASYRPMPPTGGYGRETRRPLSPRA